jgi:signal transduction histidine kinase
VDRRATSRADPDLAHRDRFASAHLSKAARSTPARQLANIRGVHRDDGGTFLIGDGVATPQNWPVKPALNRSLTLFARGRLVSASRPCRHGFVVIWWGRATLDQRRGTMDQGTRGVLTVARSVLEELDVELVLKRVLESARDVTGASYAALGVLDESKTELSRFLTAGIDEPTRRLIGPLPTGRGVLGELIRKPVPLRLADVGTHPCSYGFPVGHPPMKTFLGVPVLIAGQPFGNLYLTDKLDGSEFSEDDEQAAVTLAEFAGVAIDHAHRYTDVEARRSELEHTVSALDATIQIARALGGQTDLGAILALVAKRGRALVSARVLLIELQRGDELEFAAGAGELPPDLLGRRVDLQGTVASAALRARQTQRLSDELNRARFEQAGVGHFGLEAEDGLVVPLIFRDQTSGVLVALDQLETASFSREQQRLLEAFAASAATAVATAQSAADDRRLQRLAAAESERTRWARELHDETLQGLGHLRLRLAAAQRDGQPDAMSAAIGQALDELGSEISNLRALITDLRPAALDQLGTEAAVTALVDRVKGAGLEVDVSVDLAYEQGRASTRPIPELETAVYRIVQEALTNATKHGHAERAVVEVHEDEGIVCVVVRDDGSGFDPAQNGSGFGLPGMRERAELLGGTLSIESALGEGTTVSAELPVRRRARAQGPAPL